MRRFVMLAAASILGILALGGPARAIHDADINDDEFRCQYKTAQLAWKFFFKKGACVRSCQTDAFGGGNPAECVPPYSGSTQGCVNGEEGKTGGGICKACSGDLPECYEGANCSEAGDAKLAVIEGHLDDLAAEIYCDDSGSGDGLTAIEAKCQAVLTKYLGVFAAKKAKCLAKCHAATHKGSIGPNDCTAGAITDPIGRTQYCIQRLEDSITVKIDKICSLDAPECHGGKTSQQWVAEVEGQVDSEDPNFFCGSPSGAFLE